MKYENNRLLNPMDTAPKDREVILLVESRAGTHGRYLIGHFMQGGHCIEDHPPIKSGWYFWNGYIFDLAAEPVGWMPIPGDEMDHPIIDTTGLRPIAKYNQQGNNWMCSRADYPDLIAYGKTPKEAHYNWKKSIHQNEQNNHQR